MQRMHTMLCFYAHLDCIGFWLKIRQHWSLFTLIKLFSKFYCLVFLLFSNGCG